LADAATHGLAGAPRPAALAGRRSEPHPWVKLRAAPLLALVAAGGVLLVALGNDAARKGAGGAQPLFWAGLIAIYAPIAYRLLSVQASRAERIVLVVTLGLSFFVVKVLYNPTGATPYDELATWRQTYDLLNTGHAFTFNPLVEGYAAYPGLETVIAVVSRLAGLSIFHGGLIVIGTARATLMLALFLFLERVTRSPRAAGIGVAVYACNPSFVYFDAELGHESLALPIAAALLLLVLRWVERRLPEREPWFGVSLLVGMALAACTVTIVHHMTSYAMAAFLALWTILTALALRASQPGRRWPAKPRSTAALRAGLMEGPAIPALLMTAVAAAWFLFVAGSETVNELGGSITGSVEGLVHVIFGESGSKTLFQGGGRTNSTAARMLAIGSLIPLLALIPLGLRRVWREGPLWRALGIVAALYPLTLGFRLTQAGSETSQRASEFVFVGLAFLAAVVVGELRPSRRRMGRVALSAALTTIATAVFIGGFIVSALPANRQPGPFLVSGEARSISAPGLVAARFAAENLPPESRVLADRPDATLLGAYGRLNPVFGQIDGIPITRLLLSETFDRRDARIVEDDAIEYIVVDRRQSRELPLVGYYVESFEPGAFTRRKPIGRQALEKFDSVPGVSKIYSNGPIAIYDTAGLIKE
jgi:hypothetical protein